MTRLTRLIRQKQFHLFIFCLQVLLIEWPILSVSAARGLRSVFVYLFTIWAFFILILFLLHKSSLDEASEKDRGVDGDD